MTTQPHEQSVRRAKKMVKIKRKEEVPRGITRTGRPRKKTGKQLTLAEKVAVWEKQNEALDLRIAGVKYSDIARTIGYADASGAKRAVDSAIARLEMDASKETVRIDLARLEEFIMRCTYALRQNGDLSQVDRIMRVMEFRYRLLGINDETVRALQGEHGITQTTNNNSVMVINASPETEDEFIRKMMGAVGVNPDSPEAQVYLQQTAEKDRKLPMLKGSANETKKQAAGMKQLDGEDIVEAELVEDE